MGLEVTTKHSVPDCTSGSGSSWTSDCWNQRRVTEDGAEMLTYCARYKKHFSLPEEEVILSITVAERCAEKYMPLQCAQCNSD